jgi:hypothetical protein
MSVSVFFLLCFFSLFFSPGDTTMASLAEVEKIVAGAGARVDR